MTPSWKHEVIGRIERAAGRRRGPDFDEAFALARAIEIEDGPAIDNAAARERLANWYVRSQGLRYAPLSHHDGALARGQAGPGGLHRARS
jgi:hypothetical protein